MLRTAKEDYLALALHSLILIFLNDVIEAFDFSGGNALSLIGQKCGFGFQRQNIKKAREAISEMRTNDGSWFRPSDSTVTVEKTIVDFIIISEIVVS